MVDNTRITIMLDDKIKKHLRHTQSKSIKEEQTSVSFSKIVNEKLAEAYKIKDYVYNTY